MSPRRALVIVDVQKDFVDGSLGTARGAEVAAAISSFLSSDANKYAHIVGTLDWHVDPAGHFAAAGEQPDFSETWPVHCVAGTEGDGADQGVMPCHPEGALEPWKSPRPRTRWRPRWIDSAPRAACSSASPAPPPAQRP